MKIILEKDRDAVTLACQFLREGKAISFATDTVYGIAADAGNEKAVESLYNLKKRDSQKPIVIFVKDIECAESIFFFDEISKKIAEKFLPGKLTIVLQQRPGSVKKIAKNLNVAADNFLGFRIVDCDFIQKLMTNFDGVLAVTSANPSGEAPAISAQEVSKYFTNSDLELIIDGGDLMPKNISTVVKISNKKIEVLRCGAIEESLIKKISDL